MHARMYTHARTHPSPPPHTHTHAHTHARTHAFTHINPVTDRYLADMPAEWVCDQSGEQGHGTPLFLIGTFAGRSQHRNQRFHRAFTVKNQAGSAISQFILYLLITDETIYIPDGN